MALDDDTFGDSDSSSSSSGDTNIFMGSSYCHGHSNTNIGGWGLVIILIVLLVVIVAATSGTNKSGYDSARREQQTDAMIKAWASSMNMTVAYDNGKLGYSCQHERSRALCDIRLTNGERRHLSCGKGGCSER